jgi:hypothetical protein
MKETGITGDSESKRSQTDDSTAPSGTIVTTSFIQWLKDSLN